MASKVAKPENQLGGTWNPNNWLGEHAPNPEIDITSSIQCGAWYSFLPLLFTQSPLIIGFLFFKTRKNSFIESLRKGLLVYVAVSVFFVLISMLTHLEYFTWSIKFICFNLIVSIFVQSFVEDYIIEQIAI